MVRFVGMASENDNGSPANNENPKKSSQKTTRGPSTAKYIIEKDDGPFPLQWNEHNCAIGEFKNRYTAYTGYMARAKVKITITDWSQVAEDTKEKLWTAVMVNNLNVDVN